MDDAILPGNAVYLDADAMTPQGSPDRHELVENQLIAAKLDEVADLLEQQGANRFRVRAYRDAADYVGRTSAPMRDVFETGGLDALEELPTIGSSIASVIAEFLNFGRMSILARLRGTLDPEHLFRTVPGIGPKTAEAIHRDLHIDTLEGLEAAAHDGRLASIRGLGQRKVRSIRHSLAEMLARGRARGVRRPRTEPPVKTILEIDEEYRQRAAADELPRIAPKRFNPKGEAWLPILHAERGDWHFTALFSNTPQAHRLGRTDDWVVIFYETDGQFEDQCTVVTETRGPLRGSRVIRGREEECAVHHGSFRNQMPAIGGET